MESQSVHWDRIYADNDEMSVSWYEPLPLASLHLIDGAQLKQGSTVLDVGGGASRLVDQVLDRAYRPGVLDVSAEALSLAQERLGPRAALVEWIVADVTAYQPAHQWDLWHDRAALHFMVDEADRRAYVTTLEASLSADGVAVLATFGPSAPDHCSGLPVLRHDVPDLKLLLGSDFALEQSMEHHHRTPSGTLQPFVYARFRRVGQLR